MNRLDEEILTGGEYLAAGDSAFVIQFGNSIDSRLLDRVNRLDQHIAALARNGGLPGFIESVPTFRSLAVLFDPLLTRPDELIRAIGASQESFEPRVISGGATHGDPSGDPSGAASPGQFAGSHAPAERRSAGAGQNSTRHWQLPVRYGGTHGPDLDELARSAELSTDEVIARHTGRPLVAYMLGFLPGFAFLGDIDPALRQPRRVTPRTRVPAGSVAVANGLSAVYPWESPGGWHLIGHCPIPLFNATQRSPTLLQASDRVSFHGISEAEHEQLIHDLAHEVFDARRWLVS